MNIFRLIVVVFILFSVNNAQQDVYKQSEKLIVRQDITDSVLIKSIIYKIVTSAQNGRVDVLNRYLSDGLKINKTSSAENYQISRFFLNTENIIVSISGDIATAEFTFFNSVIKEDMKEIMTFLRSSGKWKIKNSSSLVHLILHPSSVVGQINIDSINTDLQRAKKNINNNLQANSDLANITSYNEYNVSEFVLSSSALIRKHTLYTQQIDNISTINLPLVQQYTDGSHIFSSLSDAKFTYLSGGDILGVVADRDWNRFIYGSFDIKVMSPLKKANLLKCCFFSFFVKKNC